MLREDALRSRHVLGVPPLVPRLVAAEKQQRRPRRIERIQDAERMTAALDAKLADCEIRAPYVGRIRPAERRPVLFQQGNNTVDVVLNALREFKPPCLKLVGVFDCP